LDRLYHHLVSCERGVPEVLERRFRERTAALALAESRRNKLLFAGVCAGALVVGAAIVLLIGLQIREGEVAEAVKSLHALLEESKVAEAQQYFDMIAGEKAWLNERPEIAEQHARLDGMVKAEADRRAAFTSAISGARAAGVDRPDRALVDEARRLATTSREKAEVLKFERLIAARQLELQDERNNAFNARVDDIRLRMERLATDYSDDPQRRLDTTKQLEREAANLAVGDAGGAEEALINNARALHTRLRALVESAGLEVDQLRRIQDINGALGNRAQFRSRLAEYIKRFPGSKRSSDFQKVLDTDTSIDDRLAKWSNLVAQFASLDLHSMTPQAASARIAEAGALLNEWRNESQAPMVRARAAALEPIARRVAEPRRG
jgi:hypothetical protein